MQKIRVIDSHTAGEPTRTIIEGGPPLSGASIHEKLEYMRKNADHFRSALVNEPRGSEVMVGAMLVPAYDESNEGGIIFFNNVGYLGMCGHGTIGVVETLAFLDRIQPGVHRFETVAGVVTTTLHDDRSVTIENVPSYRTHKEVPVATKQLGNIVVDIAYGGNWFCLWQSTIANLLNRPTPELLTIASELLEACRQIEPRVDHVELFGPPTMSKFNSRNFVLCPGGMYDRSPCGTGTSAKLACLAADRKLAEQQPWIQESIIGSSFEGLFRWHDKSKNVVIPCIRGRAFVNSDSTMIVNPDDPFAWGFRFRENQT